MKVCVLHAGVPGSRLLEGEAQLIMVDSQQCFIVKSYHLGLQLKPLTVALEDKGDNYF